MSFIKCSYKGCEEVVCFNEEESIESHLCWDHTPEEEEEEEETFTCDCCEEECNMERSYAGSCECGAYETLCTDCGEWNEAKEEWQCKDCKPKPQPKESLKDKIARLKAEAKAKKDAQNK